MDWLDFANQGGPVRPPRALQTEVFCTIPLQSSRFRPTAARSYNKLWCAAAPARLLCCAFAADNRCRIAGFQTREVRVDPVSRCWKGIACLCAGATDSLLRFVPKEGLKKGSHYRYNIMFSCLFVCLVLSFAFCCIFQRCLSPDLEFFSLNLWWWPRHRSR